MGWTTFNMNQPVKEWFKEQYNNDKHIVLDIAIVQRRTLYAAIQNVHDGQVFCAVFLLHWSPKSWHNFGYKDMTEFVGPCEVECPERILKLLTPLDDSNDPNGWARNWRDSVRSYHASRKAIRGSFVFKTDKPIRFSNGAEYQYFEKDGRKCYIVRIDGDNVIRLSRVTFSGLHNHKITKLFE